MKKEIIIFKNQEPTKREACKSIEHFCKSHSLNFHIIKRKWPAEYQIDGEDYRAEIEKETLDQPTYWTVRCICMEH